VRGSSDVMNQMEPWPVVEGATTRGYRSSDGALPRGSARHGLV